MPEGDTVAGHAERLRPILVGNEIEGVAGSAPAVRKNSHRLLEAEVTGVRTIGKHLVIDLSTGYSIKVHLGMNGRWVIDEGSSRTHGPARLVLSAGGVSAACYAAPSVDVDRTPMIDRSLQRLGPDLLGEFDTTEFLRRARAVGPTTMASLLLDQRVWAGIGNVYKSELLYLAGIHPLASIDSVGDDELIQIAERAAELLAANVGRPRSTTGVSGQGRDTWVYGQSGHGCRRCGTRVSMEWIDGRVTYWCPTCQPLQEGGV